MRVLTCIGLCDEVGYQTYTAMQEPIFKVERSSIGAEKYQYDILFLLGVEGTSASSD